jgi:hypothetical protein
LLRHAYDCDLVLFLVNLSRPLPKALRMMVSLRASSFLPCDFSSCDLSLAQRLLRGLETVDQMPFLGYSESKDHHLQKMHEEAVVPACWSWK